MHGAALQLMLRNIGQSFSNLAAAFAENRDDITTMAPSEVTHDVELARACLRYERKEYFKRQVAAASQAASA